MALFPVLVVIHETYMAADDTITFHGDPDYLGSYHALIERSGEIVYLTPSEHKAFAAYDSEYENPITGVIEQVNGSVDDFAYHIALETPRDGYDKNKAYHIGYTKEQYRSLAWLINAVGPSPERIVLHSNIRVPPDPIDEPRCFNFGYFSGELDRAANNKSINLGVLDFNRSST